MRKPYAQEDNTGLKIPDGMAAWGMIWDGE
jgi:hypothetical protein